MKKLFLLALSVAAFSTAGLAQSKKPVQTATISTPTVQCDMCKDRLESMLKRDIKLEKPKGF